MRDAGERALYAVADLHIEVPENRRFLDAMQPANEGDWLIVAGDVADGMVEIHWGLRTLSERFERVIWVPGNHELWTTPHDPVQLRGEERYRAIVDHCRELGIATPEDPYPIWEGPDGPVLLAPLFTLYDYSFGANIAPTKEQALARAHDAGIVCSDEMVLHPDPYGSREEWCAERLRVTAERLDEATAGNSTPTVLINHWPLIAYLTERLRYPEFAQWCGTERTAGWHTRYRALAAIYGHLHIPRSTVHDGVRFEEVSLGYPRQWRQSRVDRSLPRRILPATSGVPA